MIIILIIFIILIKYLFELFQDKHIDEDALEQQSKPKPKTTVYREELTGTVRAKDRTYNRWLQRYEYATRIVFDNGYAHTFSSYSIYMNCYPGQRVCIECYVRRDEDNNIIKRTFCDF